jgi:hypothetical protein
MKIPKTYIEEKIASSTNGAGTTITETRSLFLSIYKNQFEMD